MNQEVKRSQNKKERMERFFNSCFYKEIVDNIERNSGGRTLKEGKSVEEIKDAIGKIDFLKSEDEIEILITEVPQKVENVLNEMKEKYPNLNIEINTTDLEWFKRYRRISADISKEYKLRRCFRKKRIKNFINNNILKKLHIPLRLSLKKEIRVMEVTIEETLLRMNGLDDVSANQIEEARKDCSIEGIMKQVPINLRGD